MPDAFEPPATSLTAPSQRAQSITSSDSIPLATATRAPCVGQAENLKVKMVSRDIVTLTLTGAQAGLIYPLRIAQVRATGTTAGGIVGLR